MNEGRGGGGEDAVHGCFLSRGVTAKSGLGRRLQTEVQGCQGRGELKAARISWG